MSSASPAPSDRDFRHGASPCWPALPVLAPPFSFGPELIARRPRRSIFRTQASRRRSPVGFADIVEKVKPAVISVRVQDATRTRSDEPTNDELPFPKGSPMERFFRRFGMPDGLDRRASRSAARSGRRNFVTGQGSGFFISRRRLCGDQQSRRRQGGNRRGHDR